MADYYPLYRKAMRGLDRPSEVERYHFYERAPPAQGDQRGYPSGVQPARGTQSASALRSWAVAIATALLAVALSAGFSLYYFKPGARAADQPGNPAQSAHPASPPDAAASNQEAAQPSDILRRRRVFYDSTHPPGTIAVSLRHKFLYVVQTNRVAIRYPIGVGSPCDKVSGSFHVTEKVPRPVDSATRRAPRAAVLPDQSFSPPALYFDQGRAVHAASDPKAVGQLVNAGCFQLWDEDIADLFERVSVNDRIVVAN